MASALSTVVAVLRMVVYMLTSPVEFPEALEEFRLKCSYLAAPMDSATGGEAITEEEIAAITAVITGPDWKALAETALSLVDSEPPGVDFITMRKDYLEKPYQWVIRDIQNVFKDFEAHEAYLWPPSRVSMPSGSGWI